MTGTVGKYGCTGTTKAGGLCDAHPLKGTDPQVCIAHADRETQASVGFGGAQPGSGRPRAPRAVEIITERLEADFEAWYQVLVDARDATKTVWSGSGEDAEAHEVPDHPTRLAAFREAMDRGYGKPRQATEITLPGNESMGAMFVTDPVLAEEARELLRRAASVGSDQPGGAGARDE